MAAAACPPGMPGVEVCPLTHSPFLIAIRLTLVSGELLLRLVMIRLLIDTVLWRLWNLRDLRRCPNFLDSHPTPSRFDRDHFSRCE
jgi:hypothetical protein